LDFKEAQYKFDGATEDEKSELLKDILAFANAWRDSNAHILIGVREVPNAQSVICGVDKHLSDHSLQQFINSKTQKPIVFQYESLLVDDKQVAAISIPCQERPFFLKAKFGKLEQDRVYLRRGSSTTISNPDEIAAMGKKTSKAAAANFEVETKILMQPYGGSIPTIWLSASLVNNGDATAYDLQVTFRDEPQGNPTFDHRLWHEQAAPHPARAQLAQQPLHREDKRHIVSWPLGHPALTQDQMIRTGYGERVNLTKPVKYTGEAVQVNLQIFARDLAPSTITIIYSTEEIQNFALKTFLPDR
jgi:hypothetical protein